MKILTIILLLLLPVISKAQENYYYFDKKIPVNIVAHKLLAVFDKNTSPDQREFILNKNDADIEKREMHDRYVVMTIRFSNANNILASLRAHTEVLFADYMLNEENVFGVTGEILVFLKNHSEKYAAIELIQRNGFSGIK